MQLRDWQSNCIDTALKFYINKKHFLCLATPAAGKTIMSAMLAKQLKDANLIDYVLCFSPSISVTENMRETFSQVLNARFDGVIGSVGNSHTYQSIKGLKDNYINLLNEYRILVVFDEIHHCAGNTESTANAWGKGILNKLKDKAIYTLSLSGTPWRSDNLPITLAEYESQINCHYLYGLTEAIHDGVCRSPQIVLIDNKNIKITKENDDVQTFPSFVDLFNQKIISYSELVHNEKALKYILNQAINKLDNIRCNQLNAGGLIVASSTIHAYMISELMKKEFNQNSIVVTYKNPNAISIINGFKNSRTSWIISVGMISEGTDIPRLQVCCHLSRVKTELYFRQVLGRILRVTSLGDEKAWLYTFAEPSLSEFSYRLQEEIPQQNIVNEIDTDFEYLAAESKPINKRNVKRYTPSLELDINNNNCQLNINNPSYNSAARAITMDLHGSFREKIIATFNSLRY
jgi:superfamily II DNA or RNA helicase